MTLPPSVTDPRAVVAPGSQALGTWVKMTASESVEIAARAGFDFIVIDMEHSPLSLETASRHIVLARALGMVAFVRVPGHDQAIMQVLLDAGADGLFIPRVDTLEQARAVAGAFSFPPRGTRGSGGTGRAGQWGLLGAQQYRAVGRDRAMLILQVESVTGIDAAADMAALPDVAALFVGTADLALSEGSTPRSADTLAHVERARIATRQAGKPFGLAFGGAAGPVRDSFGGGTDFIVSGSDSGLLAQAAVGLVDRVRGKEAS